MDQATNEPRYHGSEDSRRAGLPAPSAICRLPFAVCPWGCQAVRPGRAAAAGRVDSSVGACSFGRSLWSLSLGRCSAIWI